MVEIVQVKEADECSKLIKAAYDSMVAEDVPFTESDLNLVRGCQDVAAIAVNGHYYFTIKGWEPTVKECSFILLLVQVLSHHLMPLQGKRCFLLLNNFLTIS